MDPLNIYFVRLYKMIVDTCRSVMWEMLLQMVQPPDTVINLVKKIIKEDSKTTQRLKELVKFWTEINTTTPIETDFDITILFMLVLHVLEKQTPKSPSNFNIEEIKPTIIKIRKKRNDLSHAGDISMSEEKYLTEYMEIRNHVDLLENKINSNYKPDCNCKWIRRNSSKYLNRIDRIHKEYIDPHASLEIMKLIRQCREELAISEQKEQTVEQDKEEAMDRTEPKVELVDRDASLSTEDEVESDNQSDEYEKENADETLLKLDDILGQADENKDDLFEQAQRHQAETDKQQTEIKELKSLVNIQNQAVQRQQAETDRHQVETDKQQREIKELKSLVNIQNQAAQHALKTEVCPDRLENNSVDTVTNEIEEYSNLTEDQTKQINEVLISTEKDIARCTEQQIEEMGSHMKNFQRQVQIEENRKTNKKKKTRESYELMFAREKTKFEKKLSVQRRELNRVFQLKHDIAANVKSEYKEKEIDMKRAELKEKELLDSIDKIELDYTTIRRKLYKDRQEVLEEMEKEFQVLKADVKKEFEEKKSHSLRKLKENIDIIKCESNNRIEKLKTNNKI